MRAGREQRHYGELRAAPDHGDEAILKVQHWLQAKQARAVSAADMAREAGWRSAPSCAASRPRPASRRPNMPAYACVGKRASCCNSRKRPVDQIAWSVGYEDAERVPAAVPADHGAFAGRISPAFLDAEFGGAGRIARRWRLQSRPSRPSGLPIVPLTIAAWISVAGHRRESGPTSRSRMNGSIRLSD
jgi:hypothetical protein